MDNEKKPDQEKHDGQKRFGSGWLAAILLGVSIVFYVGTVLMFRSSP